MEANQFPGCRCMPSPALPDDCIYRAHAIPLRRALAEDEFLLNTPVGRWARQHGILPHATLGAFGISLLLYNIPLAFLWTELTVTVEDGQQHCVTRPGILLSFIIYATMLLGLHFWGHWLDRKVFVRVIMNFECLAVCSFLLLAMWAHAYNVFQLVEASEAEILLLEAMELFILTPLTGILSGTLDALDTHTRHKAVANAVILIINIIFYTVNYYDRNDCFWVDDEVCWFVCGTPKAVYLLSRLIVQLFLARSFVCYIYGIPFGFLRAYYEVSATSSSKEAPGVDGPDPVPLSEEGLRVQQEAFQLADKAQQEAGKDNADGGPAVLGAGFFIPPTARANGRTEEDLQSVVAEADTSLRVPVALEQFDKNDDSVPKTGSTFNFVNHTGSGQCPPSPRDFHSAFTPTEGTATPRSQRSRSYSATQIPRSSRRNSPFERLTPSDGQELPDPDSEALATERARRVELALRAANLELEVELLIKQAADTNKWKKRAKALERELWDSKCQAANTMQQLAAWDHDMAAERQRANDLHDALISELDDVREALAAERSQRKVLYRRLQTLELQIHNLPPQKSAALGEVILRSRMKVLRTPPMSRYAGSESGVSDAEDVPEPERHSMVYDDVRHVYIGQLPYRMDEATLATYFREYGNVDGINLVAAGPDDDDAEDTKCAIVCFQDSASVHRVLECNGRHKIAGYRFTCVPADAHVVKAMEKMRDLVMRASASSVTSTRAGQSSMSPSPASMLSSAMSTGTANMTAAGKHSPLPPLPDDMSDDGVVEARIMPPRCPGDMGYPASSGGNTLLS